MSFVTEDYCVCGKKWREESPNCVFKYHPEQNIDNNCSCSKDYTCVMCTMELMDMENLLD